MECPTAGLQIGTVGSVLAILVAGHLAGVYGNLRRRERVLPEVVIGAGLTVLLLLVLLLSPEDGKAFIYFQF